MTRMERALISVSDKTGITGLAQALSKRGVEIVSTGGTKKTLEAAGIPVIGVSQVTGFPEILDGRVKTLHPLIHGGLLAKRDQGEHQEQLEAHGIPPFDLVVVNLYPFEQTVAKPDVTYDEAIENIDIGGPAMLRAAAKNHDDLTVIVDPADYPVVLEEIEAHGRVGSTLRQRLAAKAFRHTAAYDARIAAYLSEQSGERFPERLTVTYEKAQELRYGENPHQAAAFYRMPGAHPGQIATAEQLHGKELSYNNIADANAALEIVAEFSEPTVVAVKHMNPCGVGSGPDLFTAYQKAYAADPVSIFGGIVATNRPVDRQTAEQMGNIFLEIVLAPDFEEEALTLLKKKKNLRLLRMGGPDLWGKGAPLEMKSVGNGLLIQEMDRQQVERNECRVVTQRAPSEKEWRELLFARKIVKHVKSNAIVLVRNRQTIGIGAGQTNRVGAARIALEQAGEAARGAVLASDAFFPMKDTVEVAAAQGIGAIIQPGGSIRDEESIAEADRHGIAMVFTGIRNFKH